MTNDTDDAIADKNGKTYHYVVSTDDLQPGERAIVDVRGREIAVFNVNGDFHALGNYCPHQGGPMAEGPQLGRISTDADGTPCYGREGEIVSCPWHGWEFEIESGEHLARPNYRVPTYDVAVRDGKVYVVV